MNTVVRPWVFHLFCACEHNAPGCLQPSYRPTYVVCKNMSMGEMEKPSIQSFKVTIDHTHGHMKRKFSFLKQTYIFTVQNALHIVSMMEAQIQKSKIITYTLWNWEPIKYSTYNVHMSFVHFIDNLAATLFRIFWPHNDVGTYLNMLLVLSVRNFNLFKILIKFYVACNGKGSKGFLNDNQKIVTSNA